MNNQTKSSLSVTTPRLWRVQDKLIEQPSWGGRYIIDLKGLSNDTAWTGKKVGQSYELAKDSLLVDDAGGETGSLADVIAADPPAFLGQGVVMRHGPILALLIKLTQAKGNSFQVHLPKGGRLASWEPKPEAWFYLAPGLYTFGLKADTSFDAFGQVLRTIDDEMHRLSQEVIAGRRTVDDARTQAHRRIDALNPYAYVNLVEAEADDIVDLTAGGIHHSWEEDDIRFPDGNLVYEVQVDVPDELCSMRGFDKGKFLDSGALRPTHVRDYIATIVNDPEHNEPSLHIARPGVISGDGFAHVESIFRTPYFHMDRIILTGPGRAAQSAAGGFHHLFVHAGSCTLAGRTLRQGQSYLIPAAVGDYLIETDTAATLFKTYLPV
jgi:mannose-6-phosphate isomerase class I